MGRHHDTSNDGSSGSGGRHRWRAAAGLVLIGVLVATACSGGDDEDAAAEPMEEGAEMTVEEMAESAGDMEDSVGAGDAPGALRGTGSDFDIGVVGRDVIIEMRVVLSSDDIQRTVASVMAAASTLGGGVASSDVNYGDGGEFGGEGFAVLVVKVPPASVDRLLDGLDDTATVRSINQSAQDVTEQLVDLDVRIRNARQSVANVREFMSRTENLQELVMLEEELTRRQTQLEQLEAQERNLADRVALSTVTIEIVPTESVPEPVVEEDQTIADAFRNGWDAFTALLFGLAFVLAATSPFLAAGLILAVVAWLVVRRRDAMATRAGSASQAEPVPDGDAPGRSGDREPELTG